MQMKSMTISSFIFTSFKKRYSVLHQIKRLPIVREQMSKSLLDLINLGFGLKYIIYMNLINSYHEVPSWSSAN